MLQFHRILKTNTYPTEKIVDLLKHSISQLIGDFMPYRFCTIGYLRTKKKYNSGDFSFTGVSGEIL
jgi:hypothetical protein